MTRARLEEGAARGAPVVGGRCIRIRIEEIGAKAASSSAPAGTTRLRVRVGELGEERPEAVDREAVRRPVVTVFAHGTRRAVARSDRIGARRGASSRNRSGAQAAPRCQRTWAARRHSKRCARTRSAMLDGGFRFTLRDEEHPAQAGAFILVPRGTRHMIVADAGGGRLLTFWTPAGRKRCSSS